MVFTFLTSLSHKRGKPVFFLKAEIRLFKADGDISVYIVLYLAKSEDRSFVFGLNVDLDRTRSLLKRLNINLSHLCQHFRMTRLSFKPATVILELHAVSFN